MGKYTLHKKERLKSSKLIQFLFNNGKSVYLFPLRMVYSEIPEEIEVQSSLLFAVSVSKRKFKKAVDRNKIKRLIREAYRLNKNKIELPNDKKIAFMVQYVHSEVPNFHWVEKKMIKLLEKFGTKVIES